MKLLTYNLSLHAESDLFFILLHKLQFAFVTSRSGPHVCICEYAADAVFARDKNNV